MRSLNPSFPPCQDKDLEAFDDSEPCRNGGIVEQGRAMHEFSRTNGHLAGLCYLSLTQLNTFQKGCRHTEYQVKQILH